MLLGVRPLVGVCAGLAIWSASAPANPPPSAPAARSSLISSSGRFRAVGPSAAANQQLLLAAENLADRLARALEQPLPATRILPFRFVIETGETAPPPTLRPRQVVSPEGVGQELIIAQPGQVDPHAVSQAVVALLTSRYLHPLQSPDERARAPASPPAWFASGLSRHLYPDARRADLRLCQTAPGSPDLDALLASTNAVAIADRPFCTALVSYIFARANPAEIRAQCFPRWARGEAVTDADVMALTGISDPRDAQMGWDLWMIAQRGVQSAETFTPEELLARVDALLDMPAILVPLELPMDPPERLTPAVLIEHRREAWVAAVAADRLARLRALPSGALSKDWPPLIDAYAMVLEPLSRPALARRLFGPGAATLRRRLERADAVRAEWRRRLDSPGEPPGTP